MVMDEYFGTVCRFEIERAGRIARPALFCRKTQYAAAELRYVLSGVYCYKPRLMD